jgi:hypothetical protein
MIEGTKGLIIKNKRKDRQYNVQKEKGQEERKNNLQNT